LFITFRYTASGFWWLLGLRLWGTLIVTIFSIKIIDIKVLIAYSSVSHIAFLIRLILLNQHLSLTSRTLIIITHGFSSSALFFIINILYELSNSRNTMFNKGILYTSTTLYLIWALVLIRNIRAPPTINFVAEFFGVLAILIRNITLTTIVVFFILFTAAYSYFIFSLTAQLKTNNFLTFFVYRKNYLILIGHIAPIFFLTLNIQNFY
jgi:NADH:ubiquinone oxidoreductase subunit 4 (subunit M)